MIQVPTNWMQEGTTGEIDVVVANLGEIADLGLA